MDHKKQSSPLSLEDIFAAAAERVQAGEPVDAVIASYAPEFHIPLRRLLPIVETASQIHHAEIPTVATNRRAANRQILLQAAAQKRAQLTTVTSTPVRKAQLAATPSLLERLAAVWSSFLAAFAPSPMRLVMTMAALVVLIFGPTTLVTQAQSAIPGDLTYPVKQWIRAQEIAFTPIHQLAKVRRQQEEEYRVDVQKAQVKADQQNRLISSNAMLAFHGYVGEYLQIGSLRVMPNYQPDPSQPATVAMNISGDLKPGAVVNLTYQIMPGQSKTPDMPVVQGIMLAVMKQQPTEQEINSAVAEPTLVPTIALPALPTNTPTPLPTDTLEPAEPSATFEPSPTCTVGPVSGWVPYQMGSDETLAAVAARYGVSVDEMRAVNCFSDGPTVPGALVLVPGSGPVSTVEPGEITPTLTSEPPIVISPTVVISVGITPAPVATISITPTATAIPGATTVITPTAATTPESTPLGTAVPVSTTAAGPTATQTATPLATVTPVGTATPAAPATTPTSPSETATEAPTPVATATEEEGVSGAAFTPTVEPPTAEPATVEPPTTEPPTPVPDPPTAEAPTATPVPLPSATPASASEGVMAAEAVTASPDEPTAAPAATEPPPEPVSQPDSPLQNP